MEEFTVPVVTPIIEITTPRLLMRQWREEDLDPFAAMNADPKVMEFFPGTADPATERRHGRTL